MQGQSPQLARPQQFYGAPQMAQPQQFHGQPQFGQPQFGGPQFGGQPPSSGSGKVIGIAVGAVVIAVALVVTLSIVFWPGGDDDAGSTTKVTLTDSDASDSLDVTLRAPKGWKFQETPGDSSIVTFVPKSETHTNAELQDLFAPAFLAAKTDLQRDNIKRLAWFSTEFGIIRENGHKKLFGAGLISGASELDNVLDGRVPIEEFTIENVPRHDKAVWEQNSILFVFDSVEALIAELRRYFDPICAGAELQLKA